MFDDIENDMVYLVFHHNNREAKFQGVFTTEEKAVAACIGSLYCVCPAKLDEKLSEDCYDPLGSYFPHRPGGL
jgi:hypothetical protein